MNKSATPKATLVEFVHSDCRVIRRAITAPAHNHEIHIRLRWRAIAVFCAFSLILAACSGSQSDEEDKEVALRLLLG